jgi:hypothetical protein
MLGLWRDAEDVIRREVVRSFVKKVRLTMLGKCVGYIDEVVVDYISWRNSGATLSPGPTYPTTISHPYQHKQPNSRTLHRLLQPPTNALYPIHSLRHQTKPIRIFPVLLD